MKKSFACVAAVLALVGGYGVWGSWVAAQPPANNTAVRQTAATQNAPAATSSMPGTRVAVVNINKVLKNYKKAQALNDSIKGRVQAYAKQMNDKKEEIQKAQTELAQPTTTPQRKDQLEKQIVGCQRLLQDIDNDARKTIGKEQGEIAIRVFREIEGVIQAVAASNNFDIVLSYPDAAEDAEMYTQDRS
ncbi:MAG TPA: OmpH family outer membrane protein, partial [Gemmataceae bacterium]|nr:OmpH family outer membrane protein [Gemmataceae bacterium]